MTKNEICNTLNAMRAANFAAANALTKTASVEEYRSLVRTVEYGGETFEVWTDAINAALRENERVVIPPRDGVYHTDGSIIIPSNRFIEAEGAHIRLLETCDLVMARNERIANGTKAPITGIAADENITVHGGTWQEWCTEKMGYGRTGKIDADHSFQGVSACFYFGNVRGLNVRDCTFVNAGGFSVQVGNVTNGVFENLLFENGGADGLHVNGNCENIRIYDIRGRVGDDLLALNMYDWLNSSVNFGPTKCVWAEKLRLFDDSIYKALRILPGMFYFADGTEIDCSLTDCVIKNVRGINTYKMYFQTRSYDFVTGQPEKGDVGSADCIYFEDITADLTAPIDPFENYAVSDPVTGSIAVFELGSRIGSLHLENIDVTLHRDKYPESYLACIGPKTVRIKTREYFNPDVSSRIESLTAVNVRVNGESVTDIAPYVRAIAFDDLYSDGKSSGKGTIGEIITE